MGHLFVSYARKDHDFVESLREYLRETEFQVWTDSALSPGSDWRQEIDEAIRQAFAVIVVITPESKTSEYVTYEWAFALGIGKRVIPLILKPTRLHPRLEFLQHIDFIPDDHGEYPWERLVEGLQRLRDEPAVGLGAATTRPLTELGTTRMNAPGMWLHVQRGPQPGQMWNLNQNLVTVGREITNDIVINDQQVSRRHARFIRRTQGHFVTFTIEDLQSSNGTFVNNTRLEAPRLLADGDLIQLGESVALLYKVVLSTSS
jgi:hypothetical protein